MRNAAVILAFGIALRALMTWPTGAFHGDGDEVLSGLTALRILDDHDLAVFWAGYRYGALESYLLLLPIALFGATRMVLAIAPFGSLCLSLLLFWRLAIRIEGAERAPVPLLFAAFAPAHVLWWSAMPNSYALILTLGLATLLLAWDLGREPTASRFAIFGFVAGLALWTSPLSLAPVGAAALYILTSLFGSAAGSPTRHGTRRMTMLAAIPTFLLGFAPWLAFNVRWNFVSLRQPLVGVGATSFTKLFTAALPDFILNVPLMLVVLAGVVLLAREARRYFLPLVTGVFALMMFAFSDAAAMTDDNERYLLFVGPMAVFALGRFRRGWLVAVAVVWIGWQCASYQLPWTQPRRERILQLAAQQELVQRLQSRGVKSVCGHFWDVYPVSFDTRRAITPIAYPRYTDYHDQRPHAAAPWAVVLSRDSAADLEPALRTLGIRGTRERLGRYEILYAEESVARALQLADEAERRRRAAHARRRL